MLSEAARRLLTHLDAHPGATDRDLVNAFGISQAGVNKAVHRLHSWGFVERRMDERPRRNYVTPAGLRAMSKRETATRDRVAQVVQRNPAASRRQIAKALGIGVTTVQYHVKRLNRRV